MAQEPATPPPPKDSLQPHLTPQFCFDTTTLRDFLRLSRAAVDDSLSLHLNSLLTPARSGFFPSSTSARTTLPPGGSNRRQIPGSSCRDFKQRILFPAWEARENVLRYCAQVASSPESPPEPPVTRTMRMPSDFRPRTDPASPQATAKLTRRDYWGKEQEVDERTDPYSARDYSYWREGRTQVLNDVLGAEEGIEKVIKARAWSVLAERCLDDVESARGTQASWEEEFNEWKSRRR